MDYYQKYLKYKKKYDDLKIRKQRGGNIGDTINVNNITCTKVPVPNDPHNFDFIDSNQEEIGPSDPRLQGNAFVRECKRTDGTPISKNDILNNLTQLMKTVGAAKKQDVKQRIQQEIVDNEEKGDIHPPLLRTSEKIVPSVGVQEQEQKNNNSVFPPSPFNDTPKQQDQQEHAQKGLFTKGNATESIVPSIRQQEDAGDRVVDLNKLRQEITTDVEAGEHHTWFKERNIPLKTMHTEGVIAKPVPIPPNRYDEPITPSVPQPQQEQQLVDKEGKYDNDNNNHNQPKTTKEKNRERLRERLQERKNKKKIEKQQITEMNRINTQMRTYNKFKETLDFYENRLKAVQDKKIRSIMIDVINNEVVEQRDNTKGLINYLQGKDNRTSDENDILVDYDKRDYMRVKRDIFYSKNEISDLETEIIKETDETNIRKLQYNKHKLQEEINKNDEQLRKILETLIPLLKNKGNRDNSEEIFLNSFSKREDSEQTERERQEKERQEKEQSEREYAEKEQKKREDSKKKKMYELNLRIIEHYNSNINELKSEQQSLEKQREEFNYSANGLVERYKLTKQIQNYEKKIQEKEAKFKKYVNDNEDKIKNIQDLLEESYIELIEKDNGIDKNKPAGEWIKIFHKLENKRFLLGNTIVPSFPWFGLSEQQSRIKTDHNSIIEVRKRLKEANDRVRADNELFIKADQKNIEDRTKEYSDSQENLLNLIHIKQNIATESQKEEHNQSMNLIKIMKTNLERYKDESDVRQEMLDARKELKRVLMSRVRSDENNATVKKINAEINLEQSFNYDGFINNRKDIVEEFNKLETDSKHQKYFLTNEGITQKEIKKRNILINENNEIMTNISLRLKSLIDEFTESKLYGNQFYPLIYTPIENKILTFKDRMITESIQRQRNQRETEQQKRKEEEEEQEKEQEKEQEIKETGFSIEDNRSIVEKLRERRQKKKEKGWFNSNQSK